MPTLATNKKAHNDYFLTDNIEVGIKLTGSEVKSIKAGNVSLKESFIHIEADPSSLRLRRAGLFIKNMHVGAYKPARNEGYDPIHNRKLLANKKEIEFLWGKTQKEGLTIVPISIYTKNGLIKMEIAVGKGKKKWDKREALKKRDQEREIRNKL
ncbi:MAG TPA: SsrA-binding protein SmpB [Patescibacteria group bacterium]|nr:SsrA-binding protein SmpB [Patescibacteria group bacterium]